ncbi:MATE family efflux transporter [Cellulosilyticum ruminicola]|uniref:MATE family efflux transporter n=1 Tax=Cellulosilyticum ruminicola TaxID=425254 RepID=UPI0006D106E5|nr:MATE family efflux transporter [Cellulosilyticum ruminicola]
MITDMTQGSPSQTLWKFSLPMLLSTIFQQLYNIADSIIAGRYINENALAATGASYPITMLFMAVALGCNIGCCVVISQLFGAKKYNKMKTAISTSFITFTVLSLTLTVIGLVFCNPMLRLLNTPNEIFKASGIYLRIYVLGLVFLFLYNISTGIFTALGDSKTPLYFLIASSLSNILLDIIFVVIFKGGIAGIAWATFLAQGISSILAFTTLNCRLRKLKTDASSPLFSTQMLHSITLIALPSILQQSFISVGNLFIQGLINSFGASTIAGYCAAIKLNTFAITSFTTLGNGLSSFTAQNIGAKKLGRVQKGFKAGMLLALCVVIPFFMTYFFLNTKMIGLFIETPTAEALLTGKQFLMIVTPFYVVISVKLIADGVLRGAGAMKAFMISTFSDLILRVAISYILAHFLGAIGIWLSWPIGWSIGSILSYYFYRQGMAHQLVRLNFINL